MSGRRRLSWRARLALLAAVSLLAAGLTASLPPIPQPLSYHQFADQRACAILNFAAFNFPAIPNCLNVLSNAALLGAGLLGAVWLVGRGKSRVGQPEATHYLAFFIAVALTGIGSTWYHWAPDSARLLWDRLPMSLAFMALLAALIAERLGPRAGRLAFVPLLALGVASVLGWHFSELRGQGDLRPYLFMQGYAALGMALLLALFPPRYSHGGDFRIVLVLYGLALLAGELLDRRIFALGEIVSGHTLKHLIAGFAVYATLRMLKRRVRLRPSGEKPG